MLLESLLNVVPRHGRRVALGIARKTDFCVRFPRQ